jgi:hypothetical protein
VIVPFGDWEIDLRPVRDSKGMFEHLRADGGFCITHIASAMCRTKPIVSTQDVTELLDSLLALFSFARGSWSCAFLPIAFSSKGTPIWEDWSLRYVDIWRGSSLSWFPPRHPEALGLVSPGLYKRLVDPIWKEPIEVALHLYVESNSHTLSESSLILGQAALEVLAWTYFVEDKKQYSISKFNDVPAAEKIRNLLSEASVPLAIPKRLSALARVAALESWTDGPSATTELRNSLVHPRRLSKFLRSPSHARLQAWQLTLWYLERTLLWIFGYSGFYSSRVHNFSERRVR